MSAVLSRTGVFKWRSRQLSVMFSRASLNHSACGGVHETSVFQGVRKTRSFVSRVQNVLGSARLSRYKASYCSRDLTCAVFLKASLGSNWRCSSENVSMDLPLLAM